MPAISMHTVSVKLSDLLAPSSSGNQLYLRLVNIGVLIRASVVIARMLEDGKEVTLYGRYLAEHVEQVRQQATLVVELPCHQMSDLQRIVAAVKGDDQYEDDSAIQASS